MKKIKNKAKYKRHQAKKARKRKTNAETKARGRAYSQKLMQRREKEIREFQQFSQFMSQMRDADAVGAFDPMSDDEGEN